MDILLLCVNLIKLEFEISDLCHKREEPIFIGQDILTLLVEFYGGSITMVVS